MGEDDFLARWSRRKRGGTDEDAKERPPEPGPQPKAEPESDEEEAAILARLNLPVPETLQPGDDFSAFMAEGVPAFLRKRALRVLWRSNPVLANLDGLNDYDEDFTSPELTQKVLATAYRIGRGFVTEVSQQAVVEEASEADEPTKDAPATEAENPVTIAENREAESPAAPEAETRPELRPRRMRFES